MNILEARLPQPHAFLSRSEIYRDILDGLQIGVSALDPQKKICLGSA
jgi:hypothetical protein